MFMLLRMLLLPVCLVLVASGLVLGDKVLAPIVWGGGLEGPVITTIFAFIVTCVLAVLICMVCVSVFARHTKYMSVGDIVVTSATSAAGAILWGIYAEPVTAFGWHPAVWLFQYQERVGPWYGLAPWFLLAPLCLIAFNFVREILRAFALYEERAHSEASLPEDASNDVQAQLARIQATLNALSETVAARLMDPSVNRQLYENMRILVSTGQQNSRRLDGISRLLRALSKTFATEEVSATHSIGASSESPTAQEVPVLALAGRHWQGGSES